jgi:ketosteroid isomerase-like protein
MTDDIHSFLAQWADAERAGDTEMLDKTLLADGFYAVGPMGFVLPKPAWLARHRQGDLTYQTFDLDELTTHVLGETAIVTARNNTRGTYQGHPIPEAVRATLVIARDKGTWQLVALHMSFIAGTRGAPPLPGLASPAEPKGGAA